MMIFKNRADAGQKLAARLTRYAGRDDVLVLALPRGGVPVAYEVAKQLRAPLDVFLVRKLGVPGHEELAGGADVLLGDAAGVAAAGDTGQRDIVRLGHLARGRRRLLAVLAVLGFCGGRGGRGNAPSTDSTCSATTARSETCSAIVR